MKKILLAFFLFATLSPAFAGGKKDKKEKPELKVADTLELGDSTDLATLEAMLQDTLKFQPAGTKADLGGVATITVPQGFKFLDREQADYVLTKLWHNPPGQNSFGMLMPENLMPLDSEAWVINITFQDDGYVKDDDAADMDNDDMLKSLKEQNAESNKRRLAGGYGNLLLLGWAEPPHYDANTHKLYWALEYESEKDMPHTLNYNIRILGRKGILIMNAIGGVSQLTAISQQVKPVLASVEFIGGQRYTDYDGSIDKVAAYGIGGLIAGKMLLKVGFFAKFGKIIIAGLVAVGGFIARLFGRRKKKDQDPPGFNQLPPAN